MTPVAGVGPRKASLKKQSKQEITLLKQYGSIKHHHHHHHHHQNTHFFTSNCKMQAINQNRFWGDCFFKRTRRRSLKKKRSSEQGLMAPQTTTTTSGDIICSQEEKQAQFLSYSQAHHVKLCSLLLLIAFAATDHAVPQAQAASQNQQQQQHGLAKMLQVFNGNDSSQLDSNHFKVFKLYDDSLLVGARNFVYNLSLTTMREQRERIEWPSSQDDVNMCRLKGKTQEQCQNYIKVVEMDSPNSLIVCGTNAYKPKCRNYKIEPNSYVLMSEYSGEGACPYQESQNVTSVIADGQLYSATTAQFSGMDALIHRAKIRTEQFNPKQLNSPNFVSSFRYGEHVYFLFREIAIEHLNCGKTIYSRIGRVCITDQGGPSRANRDRWTSFTKARLNCSIPGEFPFAFDEIQSATGVVSSAYLEADAPSSSAGASAFAHQQATSGQELLYAVFTTPQNSIGGSAICAFKMSDVLAAFDGPYKGQPEGWQSQWLPLSESRLPKHQVRPGRCTNESRKLPDEYISFLKETPLMDKIIDPVWSQPLITMASINFRFTQVAVDTQVSASNQFSAPRTDVIFVATDDGRVFKLINTFHLHQQQFAQQTLAGGFTATSGRVGAGQQAPAAARLAMVQQVQQQQQQPQQQREPVVDVSASTIIIEELHLFDARTPVTGLLLAPGKLIVASGRQIKAVPVARCERAESCHDCVALYDPYCIWQSQMDTCLESGRSLNLLQAQHHFGETSNENEVSHLRAARQSQSQEWLFQANEVPTLSNQTLAWWNPACPNAADKASLKIGQPLRSMFSSHLQIPNKHDYASGHHLSRAPHLYPINPVSSSSQATAAAAAPSQPLSECMTFCGSSSTGVVPVPRSQSSDNTECSAYDNLIHSGQPSVAPLDNQTIGHSAAIICAICTLLFGLLFGFVFGRRSARSFCASSLTSAGSGTGPPKHHDSSLCSSTFDETNLYMASTNGSTNHHQAAAFGGGAQTSVPNHMFVTQLMRNQHHYQTSAIHQRPTTQEDQLLLQLANGTVEQQQQQRAQKVAHLPLARTGALPPLPHHHQPLVGAHVSSTLINQAQLTPPTSSSGSSNCSSSTAQMASGGGELYLNHQMLLTGSGNQAQQMGPSNNKLHQRSFSGATQHQSTSGPVVLG